MTFTTLLQTLQTIVGAEHVRIESAANDLVQYVQDWRRRERGVALAVVLPASTDEVAQVVQACAAAKAQGVAVSIVPQGGNTGMVVGSTPDATGTQIVLNLQRMNKVRKLDVGNGTITVDAGCVLENLQQACLEKGHWFPLSLGSQGSCTIGGNLSTNAGGTQVVRFGNTRELCLGLEVVTAQGEVWSGLSGLRKDNTGYDLRDLFIGAEGTLGIITAATMKMAPIPVAKLTAFAAVSSMKSAVKLLGLAHKHLNAGLTGFEVMGKFALSLVHKHYPQQRVPFLDMAEAHYCVVLELSDHASEAHAKEALERLMEAALGTEEGGGCILDAVLAENLTQAKQLWHIRECIPLAQAQEGLNIKHDISIPISSIPEFVKLTDAKLAQAFPGARLVNYGHLGDGNLHYNVQAPEGADQDAFLTQQEAGVNALVFEMVDQFEGSISAEHGIGSLKVDKLPQHKSPVALELMRTIKRALDPQNMMNPGRVVRV
ncbi:MAG TPA: FAD-binding oxidoreductase [Burkholderiaceae bacterium]|nr:FAD-binding oxidoreductase [Burkholderiaceae bacterium]